MSLRVKVLLLMSTVFVALVAALALVSRTVLVKGFVDLEEKAVLRDLERAYGAFEAELEALDTILVDWAQWDDTYEFVQNPYDEYIESNLVDETFSGLRLNFILFFNANGEVVFAKGLDYREQREIPVPHSLMEHLSRPSPPGRFTELDDRALGLLLLPEGPLMLAARPILTSDEKGPIAGTMVMARFFDQEEVHRLALQTKTDLYFYRLDDPALPDEVKEALEKLTAGQEMFVKPLSEREIAGYVLLNDLYGRPALVMGLKRARSIFAQGLNTVRSLTAFLVASYLVLIALSWFSLDLLVVSRVTRLSHTVRQIRQTQSLSTRVKARGSDEICLLAQEINEMLAALERYVKAIRQANEAKSEFVSVVAHELRNPMTNIEGYTDLVLKGRAGPVNDRQKEFLLKVRSNVRRMSKLVEDLSDISRIEAGRIRLRSEPLDLKEIIEEVSAGVVERFRDKGLKFSLEIEDSLPPVKADRDRVVQILSNLLVNAFAYTPQGGVSVKAHREGEFVQVDVVDTGVGIPPDEQEKVFEPFFRGSSMEVRSQVGTGLGLTIVKKLVELMGGKIWFTSTPGKGSVFSFTLPLSPDGLDSRPGDSSSDSQ